MHYEHIKNRKAEEFLRLTGVRRETFEAMLHALQEQLRVFGRPPKLPLCDQLLLTLMYWREYRTLFHIASTYSLSEATASRTVRRIEDALMRSGQSLAGQEGFASQPDHLAGCRGRCDRMPNRAKGAQKNAKPSLAVRRSATR